MALTATLHHLQVNLSDVDRGVYEALDLRPADRAAWPFKRLLETAASVHPAAETSMGPPSRA